jgi:phosphoenolpyruvate synthase/pyruvate phosphate dikinase
MLLARSILSKDVKTDWERHLEHHDSFYVGSDVYYTYLVDNGCWKMRLEQKKKENYFTTARDLKQKILEGTFPNTIRDQFEQILEYFGQSPIVVRSSSLLEDAFGNAFAGKYLSVFCVNQGSPGERWPCF